MSDEHEELLEQIQWLQAQPSADQHAITLRNAAARKAQGMPNTEYRNIFWLHAINLNAKERS